MYTLRFSAHCGMSYDIADNLEMSEAREKIAELIQEKRNAGYDVSTIVNGKEYEFNEPDDASLVPDDAGYLYLVDLDADLPKCDRCGEPCREKYYNSESHWTDSEFCSSYCAEMAMSSKDSKV